MATPKKLSVHNNVRIFWVPGHSEVDGSPRGCHKFYWTRTALWNQLVHRKRRHCWTLSLRLQNWRSLVGLQHTKALIKPYIEDGILDLSKVELRLITGYLTGHNCFKYHLYSSSTQHVFITRPLYTDCLSLVSPVKLLSILLLLLLFATMQHTKCTALAIQTPKFYLLTYLLIWEGVALQANCLVVNSDRLLN